MNNLIQDKYHQGYLAGLKRKATLKIQRDTVLATIGVVDSDHAELAGSALFAAGYNDAVDDIIKLNNESK